MNTALYQTYRPRQFFELIGQQHISQTLLNELQQASVSHAYLLSGPRGIGKTSTARLLAQAINCTDRQSGEPCLNCANCELILAGKAFDIIEIDAASHTGVDHVREQIIDHARVSPVSLPWKVFIIDEVHMLSTSAFNALLKILEEPPQQVLFILATTELHKVPATIISRCERLTFRRASVSDIVQCLERVVAAENVTVEPEVLQAIAVQSDGSLRDAESILGQLLSLADQGSVTMDTASVLLPRRNLEAVQQLWDAIIANDTAASLTMLEQVMADGGIVQQFLQHCIEYSRAMLLARVHNTTDALAAVGLTEEQQQASLKSLSAVPPQRIAQILGVLVPVYGQRSIPGAPQLPFEIALITLTTTPVAAVAPLASASVKPTPTASAPKTPVAPVTPVAPPTMSTASITKPIPPTPSTKELPVTPAKPAAQLTLALVQQQWPAVLKGMKQKNHALDLTFKVGRLIEVRDSTIVLAFEHQFYYDRIHDHRNWRMIHDVLEEVFGGAVTCEVVIQSEATTAATPVVESTTVIMEVVPEPVVAASEAEQSTASVWDLASQAFGATSAQAYGKKSVS